MKNLIVTIIFILIHNDVQCAKTNLLNISFWAKELCHSGQLCLPRGLGNTQTAEISTPKVGQIRKYQYKESRLTATLTWVMKKEYSAIQIEVFENDEPIALCSRYESLNNVDDIPAGACSGRSRLDNEMIGITLSPQN